MLAGKMAEAEKLSLLQRMLQHQLPDGRATSDHDIISECMGHLSVRNQHPSKLS